MIRNQWYVVLESGEVGREPTAVLRLGERLVFYRTSEGRALCLVDVCAHRGAALSKGECKGDDRIMCPFHGLEYDPSGRCVLIPADGRTASVPVNFKVRSYPTHEARGFIWIWWGHGEARGTPEFFEDIPENMAFATARDPWKTHYSRVIENQLDCVHLPFVHYNTIGRGGRTLVNGPGLRWVSDSRFEVFVYNERDVGQKPKRSDEVPIPSPNGFKLEFQFPNLWENRIAEKVRVVAAFVPVDEGNTILYLRFYQNFMRLPVLRTLLARLAMPFNLRVAHQDRRIVETQTPLASGLKIGENLIQGDLPVIEYRRKRAELQAYA